MLSAILSADKFSNEQQILRLNYFFKSLLSKKSTFSAYVTWGLILSIQPAFFPIEAAKRGATPKEVPFKYHSLSKLVNVLNPLLVSMAPFSESFILWPLLSRPSSPDSDT